MEYWPLLTLLALGMFAIGCNAGNKWQKNESSDKSITCYQCNSEFDPRCGDPFDPYTLGTVNCSMKKPLEHMKDHKPILCRKITQTVQGKVRVIRGCGYIEEENEKECYRRTGTHDVQIIYCSCTKSLCNSAYTFNRPSIAAALLIVLFMVRLA
ncbi:PREDICTED: uncharacterized protein LOC108566065 [Nicrophorus vespilloides]|uniref:Uncharacterized protein LOC108566065 n=1 Tax=Nicrophorus vespilloides TaxID=110193 RepID=A0ABM1N356_NICVS|nr:PREDICTED: uncharacterized protein LOC108566065 [Nicrophorus vespilloides]